MKRVMILTLAVALAAATCSPKKEAPMKLAAGSPAYQLAKDLSGTVPAIDPEKVTLVVTSKKFDISVGDVLQMFLESMGTQSQGVKNLDAQKIKTAVETLRNLHKIWQRPVHLQAKIDDDMVLFSFAGDQPRQQTIHADLPTPAHQVM